MASPGFLQSSTRKYVHRLALPRLRVGVCGCVVCACVKCGRSQHLGSTHTHTHTTVLPKLFTRTNTAQCVYQHLAEFSARFYGSRLVLAWHASRRSGGGETRSRSIHDQCPPSLSVCKARALSTSLSLSLSLCLSSRSLSHTNYLGLIFSFFPANEKLVSTPLSLSLSLFYWSGLIFW